VITINDELGYDIEQLWIEGASDREIAEYLNIGIEVVEGWVTANGLNSGEQSYDPYATINS
jgi:transposase